MKRPAMKRHTLLILTCLVLPGCTLWRSGGVPPPPITLPTPPRDLDSIPDAVPRAEPRSRYGNPESYVVFGQTYRLQKARAVMSSAGSPRGTDRAFTPSVPRVANRTTCTR